MSKASTDVPFSRFLPYFATRTFVVDDVPWSFSFLLDGTVFLGFEVSGVDVYAADNAVLNRIHAAQQAALNTLPADGFAQWEWTTDGTFDDAIANYAARAKPDVHPLLRELRQARAGFLGDDTSLRRGRIHLYLGQKKLCPLLAKSRARSAGPAGSPTEARATGLVEMVRTTLSTLFKGDSPGHRPPASTTEPTEPTEPTEWHGPHESHESVGEQSWHDELKTGLEALVACATRVRSLLATVGLRLDALDEQGLLERIHAALNPETARRLPALVDEPDLRTCPDRGNAPPPCDDPLLRPLTVREQLPLSDLVWTADAFTLDEPQLHLRALSLQRWPATIAPDFLFPAQFSTSTPLRIVTTMLATPRASTEDALVRKRNIAQAMSGGHARDHRASLALQENEELLDRMVSADQRLFHTSVIVVVRGDTPEELNAATRAVKDAFEKVGAVLTIEEARQHTAFLTSLPGYGATGPQRRCFLRTTENVACVAPFFVPGKGDPSAQVLYHTRHGGLRAVGWTTTSAARPNMNTLVLGGSGSGKSFNVASIFEQACLAEGGPVCVVDVQGPAVSNYKTLCELFGGTYVALASASEQDIAFNPFLPLRALCERDASGEVLKDGAGRTRFDADKLRYLSQLVCVMAVPNIATHPQDELCFQIARACILRAYAEVARAGSHEPPLLEDVVRELARYEPKEPEYKPLARDMYLQLDAWVKNPQRAKLLNRQSRLPGPSGPGAEDPGPSDPGAGDAAQHPGQHQAGTRRDATIKIPQLQVFDFYGLEKDEKLASVLLLSVAFNIWSTITTWPRDVTKFVLFDECWKLLTHPTAAKIVAELYRTGRKWGASTWAITQNLNDFLSSPIKSDLISNAATILLNQHAVDHDRVIDTLELTDRQAALFKGLTFKSGEYSELLYVEQAAKQASVLRLRPSPLELWTNTSSARDVAFRKRIEREQGLSAVEAIRWCAAHHPNGAPV